MTSAHFELEQLAGGVWAAIASPGGGATANAGIIDLGDRTLVFDTFLTPPAAEDLRAAAEQLTGRPVTDVVNSHWHGDHIRGNSIFDGAIHATSRTRELIATRGAQRLEELRAMDLAAYVRDLEEQLATEAEERKRAELEADLSTEHVIAASLPTLELRVPGVTFAERRDFGRAELLTYGGGHTESDAFLHLPEERIVFTGDLVVIHTHPWLGDGSPSEWLLILDRLEALEPETVVPGHGPVGDGEALGRVARYIKDLRKLAGGGNGEPAVPPRYEHLNMPDAFARNVAFLRESRLP